jgi:D-tyrosyl-tRNA(Tyr) deacylase
MIAVVTRVISAAVEVDGRTVGQIGHGLLVLAAVCRDDTDADLQWMSEKLVSLRVFRDESGEKHFDRDVRQVGGSLLLVSNFTVAAATAKGRRPSLDAAMPPAEASQVFARFVEMVRQQGVTVETGQFGASMRVSSVNDGPVTFIVDSRRR